MGNTASVKYPWFKKEDIDGFFALFQNNLADFVIIAVSMLGMGFPASLVFGKVIPGAAIAVMFGNFYYAYTATRLARLENRTDVTALAYGISTPVMFVFLFGVLLPIKTIVGDPHQAWLIALGACFFSGALEVITAFAGRWIQRNVPRAALLGTVAGLALTFIAGEMLFNTFEIPVIGLVSLAIIALGFIGKLSMPFKIPASLFAIIIGTILAFALQYQDFGAISEGLSQIGFYMYVPSLASFEGLFLLFGSMTTILVVVIPITIYNAVETLNNVEAVSALGDEYDVKECMMVDGMGTMIGTFFGGIFPTTVYMASIGSKWMGAGRGYSILNGVTYFFASLFGLIAVISSIIPLAAIAPIMVYIGISMIATAFQTNDQKYFIAIAFSMLPYFANYVMTRFDGEAGEVVADVSEAIVPLGQGAMFSGVILGSIFVFIIDGHLKKASIMAITGALFTFFGLMHAPALAFNAAPQYTIGYLVIAAMFAYYALRGGQTEGELD